MRPALLHPTYWPEVRRGAERLVHDLGSSLAAGGDEPVLITSHRGRPTRVWEDGLQVTRVWRPPVARVLAKRVMQEHVAHLPLTYLALRQESADLAHAFVQTEAIPALRWGRETQRPVVLTFTGIPRRESLANRWGRLATVERAVRDCAAVVVISETAREAARRWLGTEARVIRPGVDLARFSPGGTRSPDPTFLCPAALDDARKRPELLFAAFALVRRECPGARLVVQRSRHRRWEDAGPGIETADFDDHATLLEAYRRAWATVLASRDEAFGLVLLESLACGTPAVACEDAGASDILDSENVGRLFSASAATAEAALAKSMLEVVELHQELTALVPACRARAAEMSVEACAAAHRELYAEVLDR